MIEYLMFGFVKKSETSGRLELLMDKIFPTIEVPGGSARLTPKKVTKILKSAKKSDSISVDFCQSNDKYPVEVFLVPKSWIDEYQKFTAHSNIKAIEPCHYDDFLNFSNESSTEIVWRSENSHLNLLAKLYFVGGLNSVFASEEISFKFGPKYSFKRKLTDIAK